MSELNDKIDNILVNLTYVNDVNAAYIRNEIITLIRNDTLDKVEHILISTLKRCDCEIGNLLDQHILDAQWTEIFIDLHDQVRASLGQL